MAHVEAMVALGPRPAGSAALQKNAEYLKDQLRQIGLEPHEQVWEETVTAYGQPKTLTLRNVWTEIPGPDPATGPIVLLAAHYDSKLAEGHPDPAHNFRFLGAIDGAGGSAVLLELARALKDRDNKVNVWILWVDGEESVEWEWNTDTALLGSKHFAQTMQQDAQRFPKGLAARMRAMVLLDLIGSKDFKVDRDTRSNGALLDAFRETAEEMGEGERMYRYESPMTDDHEPFKNLGVTVIDLIDFYWRVPGQHENNPPPEADDYVAWWHTALDDLPAMSADALAFTGNLVWHAMPRLEQMILQP